MKRIATIGFFDGVHRGHRYLFEHLQSEAKRRGLEPLIITFDVHPRTVVQSSYVPQLLSSLDERRALLEQYGEVEVLPFCEVQPLTAAQFMQYLRDRYKVSVLLMGYDHRFGSDRLTNPSDYRAIGASMGIEVLTMDEYKDAAGHVSSTQIRAALTAGHVEEAQVLLGYPYTLSGQVVHGKAIGRTIGFPTANIQPSEPYQIIPHAGVYAVSVRSETFDWRPAMLNIDAKGVIEVHIPSFDGDLYHQNLQVRFHRFIREERQFASLEDLRNQIKADVDSSLRPDA